MSLPEIKSSPTHGQGLFATQSYTKDGTIIPDLRPSVFRVFNTQDLNKICYHCHSHLDDEGNYIECSGCHKVHFCGRLCQTRAIGAGHKLECQYFIEEESDEIFLAVLRLVALHADGRLGTFLLQEFMNLYANDAENYNTNAQKKITSQAIQLRFELSSILQPSDIVKLFYVFRTNSHSLFSSEGARVGRQVWPLLSRSNHACNANIGFRLTKGSPSVDIIALRDIDAGEELTINYVSGDLNFAERQQRLRDGWFFECRCVKCRLDEARNEQSISRGEEIREAEEGHRSSLCCLDCT